MDNFTRVNTDMGVCYTFIANTGNIQYSLILVRKVSTNTAVGTLWNVMWWQTFHGPLKCTQQFCDAPLNTWTIVMPTSPMFVVQSCHNIDMHIWGRISQNIVVPPLVNLQTFCVPFKFYKICFFSAINLPTPYQP